MADGQASAQVTGHAVLRDYPLRLWAQQQEHFDGVLREFKLLLIGEQQDSEHTRVPARLVELAEMFTTSFGPLLDEISSARQAAYDEGRDRMDSVVPLLADVPALLAQVNQVLDEVDAYCRSGDLLTLARPPELVALSRWVTDELVKQHEGGEPSPWPGPF